MTNHLALPSLVGSFSFWGTFLEFLFFPESPNIGRSKTFDRGHTRAHTHTHTHTRTDKYYRRGPGAESARPFYVFKQKPQPSFLALRQVLAGASLVGGSPFFTFSYLFGHLGVKPPPPPHPFALFDRPWNSRHNLESVTGCLRLLGPHFHDPAFPHEPRPFGSHQTQMGPSLPQGWVGGTCWDPTSELAGYPSWD